MCRVLIVDDHETSREATRRILENEGHVCAEASNGQEGLDWLEAQRELPCIILLDLRMPVMDGWDFSCAVRAVSRWAGITVIVVSGSIERDGLRPVLPAKAFWSKPIESKRIRNVHRLCDVHHDSWVRRSGEG